MKHFVRMAVVSSCALASGCVSRIAIEHWTLEPCDAAMTAEIARLAEEGESRGSRVWNDNIPYEERERRQYKLRDGTTIASESAPLRFGTNTVCVAVAGTGDGAYIQIADSMFKTTSILGRHRAGWGYILPCAASFGSGDEERLVVVKAPRTYHNSSRVYVFNQDFKCVWESEEIVDRRGWRAVVSPSHPDSVFLYNKHVACYRLVRMEGPECMKRGS
ncbi:MAG: hypothetical protein K6F50_09665 [Kiritimatiellae bacterium]|nr:hypothetical protein [Kiritimatiellia bacterium]